MLYDVFYLFLLFFIYSILGYLFEVTFVSLCTKKINFSRGFLLGPYIPIYGLGIICIVKLLHKYENDLLILFIMSTLVCTVLEYTISVIMEKLFKLRWWDYSHMSFNINGRVCLLNSFIFGIGGIIITKLINPSIESLLQSIPNWLTITLSILTAIVFITDIIISLIAMLNIKIEVKKYTKKDATETIKEEIADFLKNHHFIRKMIGRLFAAYPNVNSRKNINFTTYKDLISRIKKEVKEAQKNLKKTKK